jgi:hypothetical protein
MIYGVMIKKNYGQALFDTCTSIHEPNIIAVFWHFLFLFSSKFMDQHALLDQNSEGPMQKQN